MGVSGNNAKPLLTIEINFYDCVRNSFHVNQKITKPNYTDLKRQTNSVGVLWKLEFD